MRALLFAPHNDDEALFASFLCLRYQPLVVVCYRSEVNGISFAEREAETFAALRLLMDDGEYRQWPVPDTGSDEGELLTRMREIQKQESWDLVFAPAAEGEGHPQHNFIARLADRVFGPRTKVEHYMTYTYPPLKRSRSEKPVPYEPAWLFRKHAALACYRSAADTPSYRHFAEDLREYLA